jgi:FkbM family methyltransferase
LNASTSSRNADRNRLSNLHIREAAAGREKGFAPLYLSDGHGLHSPIRHPELQGETDGEVEVRVDRFDDLVDEVGRDIDLVKIDIEGSELDVLISASSKSLKRI